MNDHKISELKQIVMDRAFYTPDQRYDAVLKLEQLSPLDESMIEFKSNYELQTTEAELSRRDNPFYSDPDMTTEEMAPLLYQKAIINIFSVLFSVFAGSMLLAINLKNLKREIESFWCVSLGLLSSIGIIFLINIFELYSVWSFALNGLLGTVINEMFWNRYIGIGMSYRRRSALIPALIWITISCFIFLSMMLANN